MAIHPYWLRRIWLARDSMMNCEGAAMFMVARLPLKNSTLLAVGRTPQQSTVACCLQALVFQSFRCPLRRCIVAMLRDAIGKVLCHSFVRLFLKLWTSLRAELKNLGGTCPASLLPGPWNAKRFLFKALTCQTSIHHSACHHIQRPPIHCPALPKIVRMPFR